jgi:hypothetical protein
MNNLMLAMDNDGDTPLGFFIQNTQHNRINELNIISVFTNDKSTFL